MSARHGILPGTLVAIVVAGVLWYASKDPEADGPSPATAADETTFDSRSQSMLPRSDTLPARPPASSPSAPSSDASVEAMPAGTRIDAGVAVPEAPPSPDAAERATEQLMREMATSTYREQGGLYVDYLVSNGLAGADAERLVERGFRDAVGCSFDAMRAQAEAEDVPFDTVLFAVAAMLHQGDGPLLRGVIDMDAVRINELPCLLNVLQEVGIPAHVVQEIQRAAAKSKDATRRIP
jgi:hypothetical protein